MSNFFESYVPELIVGRWVSLFIAISQYLKRHNKSLITFGSRLEFDQSKIIEVK